MSTEHRQHSDETDPSVSEWDGFSDYRSVSERVGKSVHDAVRAYATIQAMHSEGARVSHSDAARAKSDILAAATMLKVEIEQSGVSGEIVDEAEESWAGDDGRVAQLRRTRLSDGCPEWLGEFVEQVRAVAWKIGYIRAGRWENEDDSIEGQVESAFNGL